MLTVVWLTQCVNNKDKKQDGNSIAQQGLSATYAGDEKCMSCHESYAKDHIQSAHHFASALPSDSTILGSFKEGENSYRFSARLKMMMERKGDSFMQTAYLAGEPKETRAISLVFGSGIKAQTFAAWQGERLFQLPITYFSLAHQWSNSPGFPNKAVFNRPITARCMECHTTYAQIVSPPGEEPERFNRSNIITGISCEKCHGPAAEHVAYHNANTADTVARNIINPAIFTRQQKLDMCGLCHGGELKRTSPPFSFQSGDLLSAHFNLDSIQRNPLAMDVHGNQLGMLSASKCFTASDMTCNSCHDPHKNERGKLEIFSQRCMSCHGQAKQVKCKLSTTMGAIIQKNCIDCHMPKEKSRAVALQLQGLDVPTVAELRSHLVKRK